MWASTMIDTKGNCIFCLKKADANINPIDKTLKNFEDCWTHLQIKDRDCDGSSPSFLNQGKISTIPPMCKSCANPAKEVWKCHFEIIELEKKLVELGKQLDTAVMLIRKNSKEGAQVKKWSAKHNESTIKFRRTLLLDPMIMDDGGEINENCDDDPIQKVSESRSPSESSMSALDEEDKAEVKSEDNLNVEPDNLDLNGSAQFEETDANSEADSDSEYELEQPIPKRRKLSSIDPLSEELDRSSLKSDNFKSENETGEGTSSSEEESESEYEIIEMDEDEDDDYLVSESSEKPKQSLRNPPLPKPTRRSSVFPCFICKEKITVKSNLEHMRAHVGDYTYQCPGCTRCYPSRYSVGYLDQHYNKSRISCESAPPKKIVCEVCNEDLTKGIRVSTHFEKHETKEKNYTCPLSSCNETFTHRQTVEYHLRSHEAYRKSLDMKRKTKTRARGNMCRGCEFCGDPLPASTVLMLEHVQSHVGDYAYQCPEKNCSLVFLSRYSHQCWHCKHRRPCNSTVSSHLKCDTCGTTFNEIDDSKNLSRLGNHLKRHETLEKNFECPVATCGERFTTRQSVEHHLRTHQFIPLQKKEMQTCSLCKMKTSSKRKLTPSQMEKHLRRVHQVKDVAKCKHSDCAFVFPNQEELLNHKISHHMKAGKEGTCDLCNSLELFCVPSLRVHYFEEHQIGRKLLCEFCEKTFFNKYSLQYHVERTHEEKAKRYKCDAPNCDSAFPLATALETHKIKDHGAEPLKCEFCSAVFDTRKRLIKHEKYEHLGKRPTYSCPKCPAVYKLNKSLKDHLNKAHPDPEAKDLKCPECDRVFKSEQTRKDHIKREHDPSQRRICDLCGKVLKNPKQLAVHNRIHTGERPFQCSLCGMRFRQQSSLFNHNKSHKRMGDKFVPKKTFDRTSN